MDENKLKALRQIGYVIQACGVCSHSDIPAGQDWGTCQRYQYQHLKHTCDWRPVSINRHGHCPSFLPAPGKAALHGFLEFLGSPKKS